MIKINTQRNNICLKDDYNVHNCQRYTSDRLAKLIFILIMGLV